MSRIKVKSFEEAAAIVAAEFVKTMKDDGFTSFKEMKQSYWWDASDIRSEIDDILTSDVENVYMYDDGSTVQFGISEDMSYRDFKKMVMKEIDKQMSSSDDEEEDDEADEDMVVV